MRTKNFWQDRINNDYKRKKIKISFTKNESDKLIIEVKGDVVIERKNQYTNFFPDNRDLSI